MGSEIAGEGRPCEAPSVVEQGGSLEASTEIQAREDGSCAHGDNSRCAGRGSTNV
jgi:hypothetical protein